MELIIRDAEAADAVAIENLFKEFVAYLHSVGDTTDYQFGAQKYLADGFGADPAFRGLVAENSSGLAGYLLYSKGYDGEYLRYLYVVDLYVQKDCRGKGIGRRLMEAVCEKARENGIRRIAWSVHANNISAIAFYKSLGASIAEEIHTMVLDLNELPS